MKNKLREENNAIMAHAPLQIKYGEKKTINPDGQFLLYAKLSINQIDKLMVQM